MTKKTASKKIAEKKTAKNSFYKCCKTKNQVFNSTEINKLFKQVSQERVELIANQITQYIQTNVPNHFNKREGLADYRTNPYVLMTTASVLNLDDADRFANFLFNIKFYMALETSFGKSIESTFVGQYPIMMQNRWIDPLEKIAESTLLEGLSDEEKAVERSQSVWREIDKSVVVSDHRYLTTIKSGPNTINDTQVAAMTDAIAGHYKTWIKETNKRYPSVKKLDIVIGLTYGTDKTTNNKENQILVKLLKKGFVEEDREHLPGVLIDSDTRSVRIYRRVGRDFWAFIGNPQKPNNSQFVFLEILLGLAKALAVGVEAASIEEGINKKMRDLSAALIKLQLPQDRLPKWMSESFDKDELFWFTTAMSAFFDEGI